MTKKLLILVLLLILAAGCHEDQTDPSAQVNTDRTYVDMRVSAGNTETVTASVQLLNADPLPDNQVELNAGDDLWFSAGQNITGTVLDNDGDLFEGFHNLTGKITKLSGGREVEHFLWFGWLRGDSWYIGTLDEIDNETYYLSYLRRDFADALDSFVTLPDRFSITAPLANEIHSRANDIVVLWQPSDTDLLVEISAYFHCGGDTTDQLIIAVPADTGAYTIPAGDMDGLTIAGNCVTTLEVSRSRTGTVDTALYGGSIIGERFSTITVTTTD
jgi:hypothetical protein